MSAQTCVGCHRSCTGYVQVTTSDALSPAALPFAAAFTAEALHVGDGRLDAQRIGELQASRGLPSTPP
jgi:hypothetical protein